MITLAAPDLFVLADRKAVMVQLPTFEWDFTLGLAVRLRAGERSLRGRQVGTGNHEGKPTVMVRPDDWASAEADLKVMAGHQGPILLEKAEA
jgi:hypothetical protein